MTRLRTLIGAIATRRGDTLLVGFRLELVLVAAAALFAVIGTQAGGVPLACAVVLGVGLLLVSAVGTPATDRRIIALSGIVTLLVAIPVNRLTGATDVILTVLVAILALATLAVVAGGAPAPAGAALAVALVAMPLVVTVTSPDRSAVFRFALYAVAFLPAYWLFGQAGEQARRRVLRVVLVLAVAEGLLAIAEPFIGHPELWGPAQLNAAGLPRALMNPLLSGFVRSQGTMGHPLPLGVLLSLGLAIAVRREGMSRIAKVLVALPLAGGLVFAGSRNSLIIAAIVLAFFTARRVTVRRGVVVGVVVLAAGVVAVATGVLSERAGADFVASGSWTHRLGALGAVGRLFTDQPLVNVLVGNGWASAARLFARGLLQTDGFGAVDDEFVLALAQGGVVLLLLLVALIVIAVIRATPAGRPMLLAVVATLFVFDVLVWPSSAVLFAIVVAGCVSRPVSRPPAVVAIPAVAASR